MEGPPLGQIESKNSEERRRQYLLYAAAGGVIENRLPIMGINNSGLVLETDGQVFYI